MIMIQQKTIKDTFTGFIRQKLCGTFNEVEFGNTELALLTDATMDVVINDHTVVRSYLSDSINSCIV